MHCSLCLPTSNVVYALQKCFYGCCGSVQLVRTTLVAIVAVAARVTEAGMGANSIL